MRRLYTLKIGEVINVKSEMFRGKATIVHIASGELFPVQVELDDPDDEGHRMKRVSYSEIEKIE